MIINESKIKESVLKINNNLPKSVKDFISSKDPDYAVIKKAYDDYYNELKKFPNPNSMELLDIKYDEDKRNFYKKYRPFVDKCKEMSKKINPSGYGRDDYFQLKIKDLLKTVDYNFPYGWKYN